VIRRFKHRSSTRWLLLAVIVGMLSLVNPGPSMAQGNPKLSVVVRGNDGEIYIKTYFQGGSWGDWHSVGRPPVGVQGGPAIAYWSYDTFIVFVRGGDNALWYKFSGGNWYSAGKPNGEDLNYEPDAASVGSLNAVAFVTTVNGLVYYAEFLPGANPAWRGVGSPKGNATAGPSVIGWTDSYSNKNLRVFTRDQNGALRYQSSVNHSWPLSDWPNQGGYIYPDTSPDATVWDGARMDTFVIGGDRLLYEKSFNGSWGDWRSLNGGVIGSPGAAALESQIDLFVRGNDNALYQKTCLWSSGEVVTCQNEDGNPWNYLGGGLTSSPDADWIRP